jgi:hypothetical protein
MAFDSSTEASLAEASDFARQALFLTARTCTRRSEHFRGEPMKVAMNTLRAIGDGTTFVLNLRGAAPNRAGQTGAAPT